MNSTELKTIRKYRIEKVTHNTVLTTMVHPIQLILSTHVVPHRGQSPAQSTHTALLLHSIGMVWNTPLAGSLGCLDCSPSQLLVEGEKKENKKRQLNPIVAKARGGTYFTVALRRKFSWDIKRLSGAERYRSN